MATKSKFVEFDPARIFACHLRIVELCHSRAALVATYKAAKRSIKSPYLMAIIISAIRERQEALLDHSEIPYAK